MKHIYGWIGAVLLVACGRETPTDVGGTLLPGQSVRTFETVLDASAFLVRDTAFSGYGRPANSTFLFVTSARGGALESRGLLKWPALPGVITVRDAAGTLRPDSMPIYFGGRIKVRIDTLRSSPAPFTLQALRATQTWDVASATWQLRVDTGDVELPWAQPGGAPGALAGSGRYQAGNDTITIEVDSQTVVAWRDTVNMVSGAVIAMETADAYVRTADITLEIDARSAIDTDTVVTSVTRPTESVFIFDPPVAASAADPRVGGIPVWRTYLQLLEGLDTVTVGCPDGPVGCRVPLGHVSISYAALVFDPVAPPPGFAVEDSLQIGARLLLVDPLVPLARSPLGEAVGVMPRPLSPAGYVDTSTPIEIPITEYMRRAAADSVDAAERPPPFIALVTTAELGTFGFVTFASPPRLRLLMTVATELQLR